MSWKQLLAAGRVKRHRANKRDLDLLRDVAERDLEDAGFEKLSNDRRFATAYNAALQLATMVVACAGYRASGPDHHRITFQAMGIAMGTDAGNFPAYYESCRRKRNQVDYDMTGIVSAAEVSQMITETEEFWDAAEEWIAQNHPTLKRAP